MCNEFLGVALPCRSVRPLDLRSNSLRNSLNEFGLVQKLREDAAVLLVKAGDLRLPCGRIDLLEYEHLDSVTAMIDHPSRNNAEAYTCRFGNQRAVALSTSVSKSASETLPTAIGYLVQL